MTIDVKGGSGLIWQQNSETKSESVAYDETFTVSEECLVTGLYLNAGQNTSGFMRVTKDGVILAEVSTTGGSSSQGYKSVIGQYVDGELTSQNMSNIYQPPSPPLHCTQSIVVEVQRTSGTSFVSATLQYTTGTFEPI